ncbi:MAG: hypothetical protein WCA92_14730, partial [Terriglobales bacterium]
LSPLEAQFEKEASQTRDYCVANTETLHAARLDPSLRKNRLLGVTIKLSYYPQHVRASEAKALVL